MVANVILSKDNPDGTSTNFLSDGSRDTGSYSNNPDGSLKFNPTSSYNPDTSAINTNTLGANQQPLTLPTTPATTNPATPIISQAVSDTEAQKQAEANVAKLNAGQATINTDRQSLVDTIGGFFGKVKTAQDQAITDESALAPYRKDLADINKQIADYTVQHRGETDAIKARGDIDTGAKNSLQTNVDDKYGRILADLAIRQSAANQNVTALTAAADRKLQLTLAPLQTEISYYKDYLLSNNDRLSQNEKDKINQIITEKNSILTRTAAQQGVANEALKAALTAGAKIPDAVTAQIIANPGQAYQILAKNNISLQTNKFTPLPFGSTTVYNPATGDTRSLGSSTGDTVSIRNNNPGNLKGTDGQFQTFATPQEGQQALIADLTAKMTGATSTGLTANSTLQDFANVWAPKSDSNDPTKYAQNLASQLGVPVNTPIGSLMPRINELAAAIAKNEGGQFVDPQAPLKIANSYGVLLTPEQASKFNAIPGEDNKRTVAGVLSGKRLISGLTTRSGYNQTIQNYAQSVDPTFDPVATEAGQKFRLSTDTQKFVANANTASNTLDQIIALSDQVNRGNIQILNNGVLKIKQGVSDPNAVKLATLSGILADELGKILGSSQGTDFTIQLGQSLVDPSLSKEAFAAQANLLKDRIANKLSEYQTQGVQGTDTPPSSTIFDNLFKQYGGQ